MLSAADTVGENGIDPPVPFSSEGDSDADSELEDRVDGVKSWLSKNKDSSKAVSEDSNLKSSRSVHGVFCRVVALQGGRAVGLQREGDRSSASVNFFSVTVLKVISCVVLCCAVYVPTQRPAALSSKSPPGLSVGDVRKC